MNRISIYNIFILVLWASLFCSVSLSHAEEQLLEKWKKAVVNIDCVRDDESIINVFLRKFKGEISEEEFKKLYREKAGAVRNSGTAIFLEHHGLLYLLTAQHVLQNEKPEYYEKEEFIRLQEKSNPSGLGDESIRILIDSLAKNAPHRTFHTIFRIPFLNEFFSEDTQVAPGKVTDTFGLISTKNQYPEGAVVAETGSMIVDEMPPNILRLTYNPVFNDYTFFDPMKETGVDLAIISLNQLNKPFGINLKKLGYQPIKLEDVSDGPTGEGADVFTVGFPYIVIFNPLNKKPIQSPWNSFYISQPNISFGKVSMVHERLPFFWVDMSILPGNSGGPVIQNDKLVGIVSGQPLLPAEGSKSLAVRVTSYGNIIKSKYIKELLGMQILKDEKYFKMTTPSQ